MSEGCCGAGAVACTVQHKESVRRELVVLQAQGLHIPPLVWQYNAHMYLTLLLPTHTHTHTHKHTHTPTHTHTYLCCYTKVCQLDCTILCEQDVATLDVAVDTAKTVQVGQALINTQQRKAAGQQAGWIYTQIETRR